MLASLSDAASPASGAEDSRDEPCGLTPASLKHLKRQRDALAEEKIRLQAENAALTERLREQQERVASLEASLLEAEVREAALQEELRKAQEAEERERERADGLYELSCKLKDTVARLEDELADLRKALVAQRQLTRDVCDAAQARVESPGGSIRDLEAQLEQAQHDLRMSQQKQQEMQESVVIAMEAANKAMGVHALLLQQVNNLKAVRLEEAMNQKVELHISVPRVTLTYNDAPPLHVSVAVGLSEERVRNFLEAQVFPHFEPLWVSLDKICKAPDGSSKKEYSTNMLDRLAHAVKGFIVRSQNSKGATLDGPSEAGAGGAADGRKSGGAGGNLAEADRRRLLEMLQAGDDRGLDSKLQELLQAGGK